MEGENAGLQRVFVACGRAVALPWILFLTVVCVLMVVRGGWMWDLLWFYPLGLLGGWWVLAGLCTGFLAILGTIGWFDFPDR